MSWMLDKLVAVALCVFVSLYMWEGMSWLVKVIDDVWARNLV